MYNELLIQLEKRIQEAVETIEMYRLEIAELKDKNSDLENQHEVWEEKLNSLIQKFETLNQSEETNTAETYSDDSVSSESTYNYESNTTTESEQESSDDSETSSYSSSTSFGSQAVASSYQYSNQDE